MLLGYNLASVHDVYASGEHFVAVAETASEEVVDALSAYLGGLFVGLYEVDISVYACAEVVELEVVGLVPCGALLDTDGEGAIVNPYAVDHAFGEIEATPLVSGHMGDAVAGKERNYPTVRCAYHGCEAIVACG